MLGLLIELHPAPLAICDLARALGGDHADVRVTDALAALERDGLVHRHDGHARISRAAVRFDELGAI